ncbi:uncharacterized protein METZ01_LOCUS43063 [marine metagenome]|uniref:RNA helicase n=1 Tax=marine metagenome TaxID=408172 RepID=A0A381RH45_9ZZZZ
MTTSFAELGVPSSVTRVLTSQGIDTPFEVQLATIPDGLAGRDICGRAPTGSGKTIAFGIPLIVRTESSDPKAPSALVLAPTRELAEQIADELRPLARAQQLWVLAAYGGTNINRQIEQLKKGVDVLVACPGRLHDLLERKALTLGSVRSVVIDEADRMADMGFLPEVRRILDLTPSDRQTLLFSATLDKDVAALTRDYQSDPVRHEVGAKAPDIHRLRHHFWNVDRAQRIDVAVNLIRRAGKTLVFTRTRHGADRAAKQLRRGGIEAVVIHGARSQNQRDRALSQFTEGQALVLVATDVAARGIHIDDIECVLHFDPPDDGKGYVHRSGRTARAGATGSVVCFVDKAQRKAAKHLQRQVGIEIQLTEPDMASFGNELPIATDTRTINEPSGRQQQRARQSPNPTRGQSKPKGKGARGNRKPQAQNARQRNGQQRQGTGSSKGKPHKGKPAARNKSKAHGSARPQSRSKKRQGTNRKRAATQRQR